MGKVIFTGNKSMPSEHIAARMQEKLDCEFVELDEEKVKAAAQREDVSLIVLYLSGLAHEDRGGLARILHDVDKVPFILAGSREELHKYFGRTEAKILRFIRTPLRFSAFISEIRRILSKVEEQNIDLSELLEAESKVIVDAEQPKHILVVDDDPVVLRSLSNNLNGLFRVSVAKGGSAAISFVQNEKPDLILLDYQMPNCNGPQTLGMIRQMEGFADMPVFFLTAVNDANMIKDALSLHPQDYILKSAGVGHLLEKIEAFF